MKGRLTLSVLAIALVTYHLAFTPKPQWKSYRQIMSDLAPQIPKNEALQESSARKPPGKVFKKCKSATFQIDGATYTIGKKSPII